MAVFNSANTYKDSLHSCIKNCQYRIAFLRDIPNSKKPRDTTIKLIETLYIFLFSSSESAAPLYKDFQPSKWLTQDQQVNRYTGGNILKGTFPGGIDMKLNAKTPLFVLHKYYLYLYENKRGDYNY